MKRLKEIVNNLKPSEIQFVKDRLGNGGGSNFSKRYKLFKLLVEGKVDSDKEAARILYKKKPDSAFSQLKKRLKQDVLNQLIIAPSVKNQYDTDFENELLCHKLILQGRLLLERGIREEALEILKKAFAIAECYELNELQLQVSNLLFEEMLLTSQSAQELEKVESSLVEALCKIQNLYLQVKNSAGTFASSNATPTVVQAEEWTSKGNSLRKIFWAKYGTLKDAVNHGDFSKAHEVGQKMMELITKNKAINSKKFFGLVVLELGKASLWARDFLNAEGYAQQAKQFFKNHFFIQEKAFDLLFRTKFYRENFDEAKRLTHTLLLIPEINSSKTLFQKWSYYLAVVYYKLGNHNEALKELNQIKTCEKELADLSMNIRLLDLIIAFDNMDLDYFDCRLECLRKQLFQEKESYFQRMKSVFLFLKELSKYQLDLHKAMMHSNVFYDILGTLKFCNSWTPQGFELIKFEHYIDHKMNGHLNGVYSSLIEHYSN